MLQYSCSLSNGYPVAKMRGRHFLVDTAMPFTIADRPVVIEGERFEVAPDVMGLTRQSIQRVTGLQLDGILGANITEKFVVKIQPENGSLVLDQYLDAFPMEIEVENLGGIAVMHQTIANNRLKAFLALGSRLSYVKAELVEGLTPIGRARDILAMAGEFETPVYQLPLGFGSGSQEFRFGVFPKEIEEYIDMANVQAAIGSELLEHYSVSLSLDEGVLMLDPLGRSLH